MPISNYTAEIKAARNAARDILRLRKVSALLGYIRNTEARRKSVEASYAEAKKTNERAQFNLRIAREQENPDLETFVKRAEEAEEMFAEQTAQYQKDVTALDEKVAEYNQKIENWHNGESKVDYNTMVSLAEDIAAGKVQVEYNNGTYSEVASA